MAEEVGSSEKRLREAVRYIKAEFWDKYYGRGVFIGGPESDEGVNEIVKIREMLEEALAASETTDLDRLVEWLEEVAEVELPFKVSQESAIKGVLLHIVDTFGVGEGE